MTQFRAVHQCLFCPQTFDSATEKDNHILDHFAQVTCTDCNQNLIRIGEYLYIRHDEVTCTKKVSTREARVELCKDIGINTVKTESDSWECDLDSTTAKPATLDAYEARVPLIETELVDQNVEEEDIPMNTFELESILPGQLEQSTGQMTKQRDKTPLFRKTYLNSISVGSHMNDNRLLLHEKRIVKKQVNKSTNNRKIKAQREKMPLHSTRYDGSKHIMIKSQTRQRCKNHVCGFKSYIVCAKCNVHLCSKKRNCFEKFHELH